MTERLVAAGSWQRRFVLLERELTALLADGPEPDPHVEAALHRIRASRGQVRLADVAREVGWSHRHLSARFAHELGLPPKRMARLARFEQVASVLRRPGPLELGMLALRAGYCDQAHLTNEVRRFAGINPTELRARMLPDAGGLFDL